MPLITATQLNDMLELESAHNRDIIDHLIEEYFFNYRPSSPTIEQKIKILWERSNYFKQLSVKNPSKKGVVKSQPHYIAYVKDNWRFTVP